LGKGIGRLLIGCEVDGSLKAREEVAAYALVVDAKDERAKAFYEHYGFTPCMDQPSSFTTIDFCSVSICNGPDGGIGQGETFSSTTPITSVLIGSADSASYITEISYTLGVPEPPSIAIFAGGLLGMVIVILRRRQTSNNARGNPIAMV
jgi:hypothetical protein